MEATPHPFKESKTQQAPGETQQDPTSSSLKTYLPLRDGTTFNSLSGVSVISVFLSSFPGSGTVGGPPTAVSL